VTTGHGVGWTFNRGPCPLCGCDGIAHVQKPRDSDEPPRLMSASDVARFLNVKIKWVYSNKHNLPPVYVTGKQLKWRRQDIEAWLEERRRDRPYLDVR